MNEEECELIKGMIENMICNEETMEKLYKRLVSLEDQVTLVMGQVNEIKGMIANMQPAPYQPYRYEPGATHRSTPGSTTHITCNSNGV